MESRTATSRPSTQGLWARRADLPTWVAALVAMFSIALGGRLGAWTVLGVAVMAAGAGLLWSSHRVASLSVLAAWVAISAIALLNF